MKQIVIPTPCNEDWNSMTPTEKGAFCAKCNLEVIDFTKKTPEEIRETITLSLGKKICGHVEKIQLELANSNFHDWDNQSPQILRSKFLYACLIVFGMSLFTGCQSNVPTIQQEPEVSGGMEEITITGDTIVSCGLDSLNHGSSTFEGSPVKGGIDLK